jgi:polygalacturonase
MQLRNFSMDFERPTISEIKIQRITNLYFDSDNVTPRPASGRTMPGFADAMHFSGCKGEIKIENSHFKGMHDDPVNVHGTHLKVVGILSPQRLKVRFMHSQSYGFNAFFPGDSIGFVNTESLKVFGQAVVQSAELVSPYEMVIGLVAPAAKDLSVGDCLENITWNPSLTIRNCRFESVNTRGLLFTTRKKVLLEGNTFYRTGMAAILISNDASGWYESGPVEDVDIRNNVFEECGYNSAPNNYYISILPDTKKPGEGYYVHRNIRITGNTFKTYDRPIMIARSTNGIVFRNNIITGSGLMPQGTNAATFRLWYCRNVIIEKNKFDVEWQPTAVTDEHTKKYLR